jgi:hypothetical protein
VNEITAIMPRHPVRKAELKTNQFYRLLIKVADHKLRRKIHV